MRRLKTFILTAVFGLVCFGTVGLASGQALSLSKIPSSGMPVFADLKGEACNGLAQVNGGGGCGSSGSGVGINSIVGAVVNILSYVIGIAAIIIIIISGFKYITSSGDTNRISSAKTTLIYALVGLAIAVLAQVLVHFVIKTTSDATTPCPSNHNISTSDSNCH